MTEIKDLKELDKFLAEKAKEKKRAKENLEKSKERAKTLKSISKLLGTFSKFAKGGKVEIKDIANIF